MSKSSSMVAMAAFVMAFAAPPVEAFVVKRDAPLAPPSSYQGQWYTTADGCSYSRAQAPGYPPMWVLILNPHHIGQPPAGRHCANILKTNG